MFLLKLFANLYWNRLSPKMQKRISGIFSGIFSLKASRLIIIPYCAYFGLDADYLDQFEPESGKDYGSYSDFFRRRYKAPPAMESKFVWPCEGYVCDAGHFDEKTVARVKGQDIHAAFIFDNDGAIPSDYYFVNIFLHNHNYHRIHSPLRATVTNVTWTEGSLDFLRPWFYARADVSRPAFRNERVTLEMLDDRQRTWYMTLVGGFGVGTIRLKETVGPGAVINVGQELGLFELGSTVCLASPEPLNVRTDLQPVFVGQRMPLMFSGAAEMPGEPIIDGPSELPSLDS